MVLQDYWGGLRGWRHGFIGSVIQCNPIKPRRNPIKPCLMTWLYRGVNEGVSHIIMPYPPHPQLEDVAPHIFHTYLLQMNSRSRSTALAAIRPGGHCVYKFRSKCKCVHACLFSFFKLSRSDSLWDLLLLLTRVQSGF